MKNTGRFVKGQQPPSHKKDCQCFRCTKTPYNKGKNLSEETKRKISQLQIDKSPFKQYTNREWLVQKYLIEEKSFSEIAKEIKASPAWVQKWLNKFNIPKRKCGARYGDKNVRWKGGIAKHSGGYIWITRPDHPYADTRGYILEHRLVMEHYIKRYLEPKEVVHHINGNTSDNRIENLELFSCNKYHMKNHKLKRNDKGQFVKN